MIDYGTRRTDLALKRLEARLRAVYRQAEKDIAAKTEDYWKRHAARDEKYRQQVKDGKLSKEDYEAWQRGQVFQGDAWTARKGEIQNVLYNADAAALQMINDGKVDAFAANANYMGYLMEHDAGVNFGFSLYDGPTVARLLKDDPQILPKARVKKDKAYVWYNKLVNNCVLQGIIQGESIGEIAERIEKTTGERTRTAMLRNARTAYTGAQNAGRLEGMRQAEKLGVNVKKRWLATLDSRTRDAHADLDGQVQDRDKPFKSPLGDIMFPGDPTAKPGNVYNCRCTITYVYPEYAATMTRRDNENGEVVGDMTYREWEAMKQGGNVASQATTQPVKPRTIDGKAEKLRASMDPQDYAEAVRMIDGSPAEILYENYADQCAGIVQKAGAGVYRPSRDTVEYGLEKRPGMHKFTTMAHEMAHMFDAKMGRYSTLTFNEMDKLNAACQGASRFYYDIFKPLPSTSDRFLSAMREDKAELKKLLSQPAEIAKMKTGNLRNASAGVQDAMDGFFDTQDKGILPWGHGKKYYNRKYNSQIKGNVFANAIKGAYKDMGFDASNQAKVAAIVRDYETASELWANGVSAVTCGGEELEAFRTYMPHTIQAIMDIIGGVT